MISVTPGFPAAGDDLAAGGARLHHAAAAVAGAGEAVRVEAARALGGSWLGAAATAAHAAAASHSSLAVEVASILGRAAIALARLGIEVTDARRQRARVVAEAACFGWRVHGDFLWPAAPGPLPLLGQHLVPQLAGIRGAEEAADAAAAGVIRTLTAALASLRRRAARLGVVALVDPVQMLLLERLGLAGAASTLTFAEIVHQLRELLPAGDPVRIRAFVESLPVPMRQRLAKASPELVGGTDGMPPTLRYAANRVLIQRALAAARQAGEASLSHLLAGWLARPDRQYLLVDLAGGRIAEVFGDLDRAAHVAVVVPGILNSLSNFDASDGFAASVRGLHERVARSAGCGVATIAWMGYPPPGLIGAPFAGDAVERAHRLRYLVAGLVLRAGVTTTVVAHSYGTLLAGRALSDGLRVDSVVLLGSPGVGVLTAAGLQAFPGTRLYAARAPFDYVGWSENFGRDPTDSRFGAVRIATGAPRAPGPRGHSQYFSGDTESTRNLARIINGRYDEVSVHPPEPLESLGHLAAAGVTALGDGVQAALAQGTSDLTSLLPSALAGPLAATAEAEQRLIHLERRRMDPDLYLDITDDEWAALHER
ncbi:MAG: alpha/beta hydrolase family protein [Actinomycetota bacterium]|nr:alpha/beta hydrolase family protein [Actinomycetota bacterium]